jgi:hypothetical protein
MINRINPSKVDLRYLDLIESVFEEFKNHFENTKLDDFIEPNNDDYNIWLKHLANVPIIIYINSRTKCIWSNSKAESVFGFSHLEWINQPFADFLGSIYPSDLSGIIEILDKNDLNDQFLNFEFRMKDKNSKWHILFSMISPIIKSHLHVDGFRITSAIDVTDLSENETELLNIENDLQFFEEKEIILEKELLKRDNQLKIQTKDMLEKDEYLFKIKNMLDQGKVINEKNQALITNIKKIDLKMQTANEWLQLEEEFFKINPMFMSKLSSEFVNLTNMEIRICAMIKLNMRSKEISNILKISQKTIDKHRQNIRKKIQLDESIRLSHFLYQY